MRRALLCACNEYRDPAFAPLKYPMNDIEEIRHLLEEPDLCEFEDIELLANPGRGEAHEAVEHLTADSSHDDLILFYFSGHGKLAQDGSVSLVLNDTKENRLHSTGLLDDQLRILFNASRARQRVIILDCCYSGAVGEEGFKRASDDAVETMAHQIKGTFILTASTKFQPAMECAETQGSAFTSCLVEGIRTGAAAEKDSGCVTLAKLGEYLSREVPLRSNQQPKFWDFGGVGGTVFARVPTRFDAAWTEQTLKRLRQMMAREQIDDTLFVELQRVLRSGAGSQSQERLVLVDDLAQRRMKPIPFLRKWQAFRQGEEEEIEEEKLQQENLERERRDRERLEQERLGWERLERDRLERERLEREKLEWERLHQEKLEREKRRREGLQQEAEGTTGRDPIEEAPPRRPPPPSDEPPVEPIFIQAEVKPPIDERPMDAQETQFGPDSSPTDTVGAAEVDQPATGAPLGARAKALNFFLFAAALVTGLLMNEGVSVIVALAALVLFVVMFTRLWQRVTGSGGRLLLIAAALAGGFVVGAFGEGDSYLVMPMLGAILWFFALILVVVTVRVPTNT